MSICCPQNPPKIFLESAILFQSGQIDRASYHVSLTIIGVSSFNGYGVWTANWDTFLNDGGIPQNTVQVLNGQRTTYQGTQCSGCIQLLANLQIKKIPINNAPFPTDEPTTTIWKGNLNLTGGSVLGVLNRQSNQGLSPLVYNMNGIYRLIYNKETCALHLNVESLKIF